MAKVIRFKSMDQQQNNAKFSFQGFNKVLKLDSRLRNIHNQEYFDPTDDNDSPPIPVSPDSPLPTPTTDSNNEPKQCSSKDATSTNNDNAQDQDIMQMDETMTNQSESTEIVDAVNVPDNVENQGDSSSDSTDSSVQCLDYDKIEVILASQRARALDVAKIKEEPASEAEDSNRPNNNPPQLPVDGVDSSKSISPGPSRNSGDGENQQPTKEPDQDQDSHESETPPPAPAPTRVSMVSPQFCIFCPASFKTEQGYISHISECNAILTKIADYKKRKCFICCRSIPHFNVTGMLRHAISCIIIEREERLKQQTNDYANANNNETRISKKEQFFVKPEVLYTPQSTQNRPRRSSATYEQRTNITSGCFTPEQKNALISFFNKKQYIDENDKAVLSEQTGLSELQIKRWFQMRRHQKGVKHPKSTPLKEPVSSPSICVSNSDSSNSKQKKRKYNGEASSTKILEKQQFSQQLATKRKRMDTGVTKVQVENIVEDDDEGGESSSSSDSDSGDDYGIKIKKNGENLAKISEKNLKILLSQFEQNPNPSVLDIVRLISMTKLTKKTISAWFARKNGNSKIKKSGNKINARASPLLTRGQAHSSPKVGLLDLEDDFYKEEEESKSPKLLTIRQKLGAMKKTPGNKITDILNGYKDIITQILIMYSDSDNSTKQALELEVVELDESLKNNNPYDTNQIGHFEQWEEDFIFGMFPESDEKNWIEIVTHFKEKILQVWTRVIVYSKILNIPLEEATMDIYHLMLARGQKDTTDVSWTMPNLFKQVKTSKIIQQSIIEDFDDDNRD